MSLDDDWETATPIPRKQAAPIVGQVDQKPPVAARPARGDELSQPDPSPAPVVTAPSPKPLVDVTGSIARSQDAIRRGAPGEDLADSEGRAHATEDQNNPVKDDWLAKELISGAATGPVLGLGIKAAGGLARRGASAFAESEAGREAGRALSNIAEGAGKKLRERIGEIAPEAKTLLKEKPWLAKGKTSADVARNFATEGKTLAAEREHLLELADARAIDRAAVPTPVEGEPTAIMSSPNHTPPGAHDVSSDAGYLPHGGRPTATSENVTQRLETPNFAPEVEGAPAVVEAPVPGAGTPLALISEKVDARIAKLAKGTMSEREVAAHMEASKAKLLAAHGEAGAIPSTALRRQISDYQTAFDKTATATSNRADKEMSKALHDALRSHVDDPELQGQIDALTSKMEVTTNAEKALRVKAKAEKAPGGTAGAGLATKILHDVEHSHGTPNAIAKVARRLVSPAVSVADRAAGAVARRVDPALAAIVKRGVAEHWTAARLAKEIAASGGDQ